MSQIHSYHTFLFPFKWEICQGQKHHQKPLSQRANIDELIPFIDKQYWSSFKFEPKVFKGLNTYNEFAYFYDYPRDVLNLNPKYQGVQIQQFEYNGLNENSLYSINIKGQEYSLSITEVLLNLYENGIGVLSFFLENRRYSNFDDILKINDFGRRIYPQYLGNSVPFTNTPKGSILASKITISNTDTCLGNTYYEDFSYYDTLENIQNAAFVLPKHIVAFLGEHFKSYAEQHTKGDVFIAPIIDDRMFTLCYTLNDGLLNKLAEKQSNQADVSYGYETSKKWYEYIFVDGDGINCHSHKMLKQQIENATYDRWIDNRHKGKRSGILFGLSRYSFVGVASKGWFTENVINKHFLNQYFQLVLLSLVQRAYIINFSGEVARISQRLNDKGGIFNQDIKSISKLYLLYIKFVNRIFFREITPQEQGIELYDLLQKQMRIRDEVKDLDAEIEELNSYAESQQQGQLTLIAGRFLFPSLIISLLGLDAVKECFKPDAWQVGMLVVGAYFISDYLIKLTSYKR